MSERGEDEDDYTFQECAGYDGFGWYYWATDYPDEGVVGAFGSEHEAKRHAWGDGAKVAS